MHLKNASKLRRVPGKRWEISIDWTLHAWLFQCKIHYRIPDARSPTGVSGQSRSARLMERIEEERQWKSKKKKSMADEENPKDDCTLSETKMLNWSPEIVCKSNGNQLCGHPRGRCSRKKERKSESDCAESTRTQRQLQEKRQGRTKLRSLRKWQNDRV